MTHVSGPMGRSAAQIKAGRMVGVDGPQPGGGAAKATRPGTRKYGEIEIRSDQRPAVKPGSRSSRYTEIYAAAAELKPGEWFFWKGAPKSATHTINKMRKAQGLKVICYITPAGERVVAHEDRGEAGKVEV